MNAADVRRLWQVLASRYADRDRRYARAYYAYRGEYNMLEDGYSNGDLRDIRRSSGDHIMVWNLIYPIVEAHRMIANRLPSIEVRPKAYGDPLARGKAEKLERILYATWDQSRMVRKHGKTMFHKALYNTGVWFVRWDKEKGLPIVQARRPTETYPVFGRSGEEVVKCIFRWEEDAEAIWEDYPELRSLLGAEAAYSRGKLEVLEYVDQAVYAVLVGDKWKTVTAFEGQHGLGFCPVVIDPAGLSDEWFAAGPVDQIVSLNDYLNRFQTKWGDALEEMLFQPVNIIGDGASNVAYDRAPGAVNRIEGDTIRVEPGPMPTIPREAYTHLERIEQLMRRISNFPSSASGELDASVVTGKAVGRLQGVMTGMAAESQYNTAEALKDVNRMLLSMYDQMAPRKKFSLWAEDSVSTFSSPGRQRSAEVTFVPAEDIAGQYDSRMNYSPFGTDWTTGLTLGMQMVQAGIAPKSWVMEQVPGLGDIEANKAEIMLEKREQMELEVDLQTRAQIRIMEAQAQLEQQKAQAQGGGAQAESGPAAAGGQEGTPGGPEGAPMVGNTMVLPGGQPAVAALGPPLTGPPEQFPIPYTALKPFNQATDIALGKVRPGMEGLQGEALPGRTVVTADEVIAALNEARNRKGQKTIQKLRGEVYLIGEIARRGYTDARIEFAITVKSDQQVLVNALPQWAVEGRLSFTVLEPGVRPPDGIPVKGGGTSGISEEGAPVGTVAGE